MDTQPESIDTAEDRELFKQLIDRLGIKQPPSAAVRSKQEALKVAESIGYPVLVRPSYVLGGRAMRIVYDEEELTNYLEKQLV